VPRGFGPKRHASGTSGSRLKRPIGTGGCIMEWHKPEVTEQEVGLEVTTYLPAELDHD